VESDYRPERWDGVREDYRFTGKEEDVEIGLQYFGKRYYAPQLGRWVSADPLSVHGLGADANVYAYVHGAVLKATDPFGLDPLDYLKGLGKELGKTAIEIVASKTTGPIEHLAAAYEAAKAGDHKTANEHLAQTIPGMDAVRGVAGFATALVAMPGQFIEAAEEPRDEEAGRKTAAPLVTLCMAAFTIGGLAVKSPAGAPKSTAPVEAAAPSVPKGGATDLPGVEGPKIPGGGCFVAGTAIDTPSGPQPIETLRVGDRVWTNEDTAAGATSVDPATWRRLHVAMPNPDGSDDVLDIELLRPLEWIEQAGAVAGATFTLTLPEMRLQGQATVESVAPASVLPGAGRVVRATVSHLNGEVRHLEFEGCKEGLAPTATHRFFSLDRSAWIDAAELHTGERLLSQRGFVTIRSNRSTSRVLRVYNLEVETDHSYFVGSELVLTHNVEPSVFGGQLASVDPAGAPFADPAPPSYASGHPSRPVVDHVHNRARGGHPTDPANLDVKTWEANSRKAGFEGNYAKDLKKYMDQGLSREQAEHVLQGEHDYILNDVHARPVSPAALDKLPTPGNQ
jgi:RHS repeat-associated protein